MTDAYDLAVIGAGQAGPALAASRARKGERVVLIERRRLGGTCVNDGCTPTKTLRKSARVAHIAKRGAEFGVNTAELSIDFGVAMNRMREVVSGSVNRLNKLRDLEGLTVLDGHGRIEGRTDSGFLISVSRAGQSNPTDSGAEALPTVEAKRVVINTGTRAFIPPTPGLDAIDYLDNTSLLALDERPEHLVILGGSYIGLEMGQIFSRLGSQVTIVERGPRVASREDPDVSAAIEAMLTAEGVTILTNVGVESVSGESGPEPKVTLNLEGGDKVAGTHLLVAVGRTPNTNDLGLEALGVEVTDRGIVPTNDLLETSIEGLWALGDINGRGAFTHTSYHDFEILDANWDRAEGGASRSTSTRIPIYAMFTDPPLGHVGIYEADAKKLVAAGAKISQAVLPMTQVSRAREESETIGVIKLLIDETTEKFLGATMLGIGGDEIIQVVAQVMAAGGTWRSVREALPIHPTVTEFLPTIIDLRQPLTP